jgi:hypothetical protein
MTITALEQIDEAMKRIGSAKRELGEYHTRKELFTENEVFFRIETLYHMILILQSDLRSMKEEWTREIAHE